MSRYFDAYFDRCRCCSMGEPFEPRPLMIPEASEDLRSVSDSFAEGVSRQSLSVPDWQSRDFQHL